MSKPDLSTVPDFYKNYVENVKDFDLVEGLQISNERALAFVRSLPEQKGEYRYQPGKWSIKEVLCHMMDAERIFSYRALRFARNDKTSLQGFDENDYAPLANAHARTLEELSDEMLRLRLTTIDLFKSFTPEMLLRTGEANGARFVVNNLAFITSGHESHHMKVLRDRYV